MASTTNGKPSADTRTVETGTDGDGHPRVTITNTSQSSDTTQLDGDQVNYSADKTTDTRTSGEWPAEADQHVRGLIYAAQTQREARENVRANHRNFNRLLTLVFTLIAGLAITFLLNRGYLGAFGVALAPYSFVITVAGDTVLTAYAFIKRY